MNNHRTKFTKPTKKSYFIKYLITVFTFFRNKIKFYDKIYEKNCFECMEKCIIHKKKLYEFCYTLIHCTLIHCTILWHFLLKKKLIYKSRFYDMKYDNINLFSLDLLNIFNY